MVRTGEHSGFLVGWNDGLGWIFVQGGRTEFSPADYYIPHIHPHKQPVGRDFPFPPRRTLLVCVVPAKIFAGDDASLEGSSPRGGKMPQSGGEDRALFTPVTTNA